jgi:hypothetical protein
MKRSSKVTLTVVAAMGLAACSRRYDPCEARSFDATACSDAVRGGGYYYGGSWYPMRYHYPYPYYYDSYRSHLSRGGTVVTAPSGAYARPGGGASAPSSGGVTRGGFGSTGAGHSAGE